MKKPAPIQSDRYTVEVERRLADLGATRVSRETIVVKKSPGMLKLDRKQSRY